MSLSIECNDEVKEFLIDIKETVKSGWPASACCICRVPEYISRINKEAYTPQLVSIGPIHHGNEKYAHMEKLKGKYVKSFLYRIPAEGLDEILTFARDKEQDIRDCYAETINLRSPEFVRMIICDAIFIIEHFLRTCFECGSDNDYSLPHVPTLPQSVSSDLLLLENQLPYFVLDGIYNMCFEECTFMEISNIYFSNISYDLECDDKGVKHFTDLIRSALVKDFPKERLRGWIGGLPCAAELHASGVKFRRTGTRGLVNITLRKRKLLLPCWKVPELHIPPFAVYDSTEYLLRNVMALEQFLYQSATLVCNYVIFMGSIINTEKDVELLVARGIIFNAVGNNAEVANMLNKLNSFVSPDESSSYYNISKKLREHCSNPSNRNKAFLRNVYFSNMWTGLATIAAGILLLLTVIQTICSIMQVV